MKQQVINILNEIRPEFDFSQAINLTENSMLDSFDIVILVCELEKEFGISIDGTDIIPENFTTIESIVNLMIKTKIKNEPIVS